MCQMFATWFLFAILNVQVHTFNAHFENILGNVYFSVSVALDVIRLFLNFFTLGFISFCVSVCFYLFSHDLRTYGLECICIDKLENDKKRWVENAFRCTSTVQIDKRHTHTQTENQILLVISDVVHVRTLWSNDIKIHWNAMQAMSKHKPLSGTANSTFNRYYNRALQ